MFFWIALVVIAQFINAIVAIIDKYIVTSPKAVSRPFVYAFYLSVLSSLSIVVFFFSWISIPHNDLSIPSFANVSWPSPLVFGLSLLTGFVFFLGLIFLFHAFKRADASDVVPVASAVSAIATFLLSFYIFNTELSHNFLWGFALLVIGTILVSHLRFNKKTATFAILSGLFFAVNFIALKEIFLLTNFDNGFFWSRMGLVAIAFLSLLIPKNYYKVTHQTRKTVKHAGPIVLGNKVLGGLAGLLILKAIDLGDVAIVQALGGVQFAFLLLFAVVLGRRTPHEYGENVTHKDLLHKVVSVGFIIVGLFVLFAS